MIIQKKIKKKQLSSLIICNEDSSNFFDKSVQANGNISISKNVETSLFQ